VTAATLLIALALDLALGDPPSRWHPVAWVGRALEAGRRGLSGASPGLLLVGGAALVAALASVTAILALTLGHALSPWPLAALLVDAALLKGALSVRGLFTAVTGVRQALEAGRLETAREALGRDLVSRPVALLDAGQVASGAVESLAENLTDSLVAPVLFFVLGGVPAAWAYRVVNTADAMLGYHEGELEYLGKGAARLDDALNWMPARLAAAALMVAAALAGGAGASGTRAWRMLRRDGGNTASPNAGRTMAAMAGGIGVCLAKPGHYSLGDGAPPGPRAIGLALRVAAIASALAVAAAALALAMLDRGP
jgi:adenosylcobinamide-phosphate synthase